MANNKIVFIGFNLPAELHKFVKGQMKKTYKSQTQYFKDLVLKDKLDKEEQKESSA